MLIILSPAKTMDMSEVKGVLTGTKSLFENDAEVIASRMKRFSEEELGELLKVSPQLAKINYQRYQHFDDQNTPRKQALLAYDGSVFKAIDASSFSNDDFIYAQSHLRIISTLYGLVRPLDLIKAYRIAFYLKLETNKDLYAYWLPRLTTPLIQDAKEAGNIIVNLASLDVLGALQMDKVKKEVSIITPEFKELRNGKYETIRTYAKVARGEMSRYILLNRIELPEQLKLFSWKGFSFNNELSNDKNYLFTRIRV